MGIPYPITIFSEVGTEAFHLRPWARRVLTWLEFSQATKAGCNSAMSCWYMNPNEG